MPLSTPLRKAAVVAHIVCSIGWIGAVAAFLALAVTGVRSADPLTVRAVYLAMEPVTWWIIVPFAFASLGTGVLLSLGTPWGLIRYYWVLFKLLINLLSIALLLLHTGVIDQVAQAAAAGKLAPGDLSGSRTQLVRVSIYALGVLVAATVLSVYKPRGITPFQ